MSNAVLSYFERCGIEFDTAVNVLTGGMLGQTVSLRVAQAERDGKTWGCWFCWFLNWAVQRHHCALQFTTSPPLAMTFLRAGVAFAVGIAASAGIVHGGIDLVEHLVR